jgi:uncharacterized membrane protein
MGATIPRLSPEEGDSLLGSLLKTLILLANLIGGLVIGVGLLRGVLAYVTNLIHADGGEVPKEAIRLSLGRSLSLALEFQLAADILGTALNPSLRDIETLGAIIVLRTVLNFFLGRELDAAQRREQAVPGLGQTGSLPDKSTPSPDRPRSRPTIEPANRAQREDEAP